MKKLKELYLKLFHKHDFKLVKWRLVHYPDHEPSRRIYLLECEDCGKKKEYLPSQERNEFWERTMEDKHGFWTSSELENK